MSALITATIKKELYQRRWAILGFSLAAFLFLVMYISIYPSFQHETAKFNELLKSYPKALLQAFNIEQIQLSTVAGYISVEHFSFIWPLMAILFGLSMAGQSFAGEIEKGTLALMLSLPLGRARIFFSKYLSGLIALAIFLLASTLTIVPLAALVHLTINVANVWRVILLSTVFIWAIYALGLVVSCAVSEKSRVYFALGGLLLVMYVANIMSGLVKSLSGLKYISFFHYYSPDKALVHGQLFASSFYVFVATICAATALAFYVFRRRDISV